jgi:hypothetical protein
VSPTRALALLAATALVAGACPDSAPADPADTTVGEIDIIYPPEVDAPVCSDGIIISDLGPEEVDTGPACVEGDPCDDGNPCSVGDACAGGVCVAGGERLDCDDASGCTIDVCVPYAGCEHQARPGTCDDGDPCTLGDACADSVCVAGTVALTCDDLEPCTDDACEPGVGCSHVPAAGSCDDGDPCTDGDACADGACVGGERSCACASVAQCVAQPNQCLGPWVCDSEQSTCVPDAAQAITCPTSAPCQRATCDPATGACGTAPLNDGVACDDGEPCSVGDHCESGSCVATGNACQCASDADCAPYEDGDFCNGTLTCDLGAFPPLCVVDEATVVTCPTPTDPCAVAACDPTNGTCSEADVCTCPDDMARIGAVCVDRYEASRPDATAGWGGSDTSRALSQADVMPWWPVDLTIASAACQAAGKRVCAASEVQTACEGPEGTAYAYGDSYVADACNGIDAFCDCDSPNCADLAECPYPHCRSYSPEGVYGEGCGAAFQVRPTGSFPKCINDYGAWDLSGNVWELVTTGGGGYAFKGGAYNCSDSEQLHRCDGLYDNIAAKGFRCCADATP